MKKKPSRSMVKKTKKVSPSKKVKKVPRLDLLELFWTEEQRRGFVEQAIENANYMASQVKATDEGMVFAIMMPRMFVLIASVISIGIEKINLRMVLESFLSLDRGAKKVPRDHIKSAIDAIVAILPAPLRPKKTELVHYYNYAAKIAKNTPPDYIAKLPVFKGMDILHARYLNVIANKQLSEKKGGEILAPVITYMTAISHGLTSANWRQTIFSVLSACGEQCVNEIMKFKDLDKIYSTLTQMISIGTLLSSAAGAAGMTIQGMNPMPLHSMGMSVGPREHGMNKQPRENTTFQSDPSMFE